MLWHRRRRVATDRGTPLVAATRRPPSTHPARVELRRVRLGVAAEGVEVGDAGDVDDNRGGTLWQQPPPSPPTVLSGKVKTRHIWGLPELDPLLLSPYSDTMHATREVSEDPMVEEVAANDH